MYSAVKPLGILLAPFPQGLIEAVKGNNSRNRHKGISAAVTHLVFHVAFFVAGCWIAEFCAETVMHHEAGKAVCENSVCTLEYLHNGGGHIVKAQHRRNAANMLKDTFHTGKQAFLVLRGESLGVPFVGIREGNG